jgi:hypothetical protein
MKLSGPLRCRQIAERCFWNIRPQAHSTLMWAALIIGAHISVSARVFAASSSGIELA